MFYELVRQAKRRWQTQDNPNTAPAASKDAPTIEVMESDGTWTSLTQQTPTQKDAQAQEEYRGRATALLQAGWIPVDAAQNEIRKKGRHKTVNPAVAEVMRATIAAQAAQPASPPATNRDMKSDIDNCFSHPALHLSKVMKNTAPAPRLLKSVAQKPA